MALLNSVEVSWLMHGSSVKVQEKIFLCICFHLGAAALLISLNLPETLANLNYFGRVLVFIDSVAYRTVR